MCPILNSKPHANPVGFFRFIHPDNCGFWCWVVSCHATMPRQWPQTARQPVQTRQPIPMVLAPSIVRLRGHFHYFARCPWLSAVVRRCPYIVRGCPQVVLDNQLFDPPPLPAIYSTDYIEYGPLFPFTISPLPQGLYFLYIHSHIYIDPENVCSIYIGED